MINTNSIPKKEKGMIKQQEKKLRLILMVQKDLVWQVQRRKKPEEMNNERNA